MDIRNEHTSVGTSVLRWLITIITIIIFVIVGIAIYDVKNALPTIGYIWIVCIAIVPIAGVIGLLTMFVKWLLKAETIEIGQNGTLLRLFGKTVEYYPLGIKEHRNVTVKEQNKPTSVIVPDLVTVIKNGMLSSMELLLGYHVDGSYRYGTWDDLRTFVIAGKSRSGKTVTMVFYIVQALLARASVYVCDPHYNKKSGLLKVMEPLLPFVTIAKTDSQIMQLVTDFSNEMKLRVANKSSHPDVPMLLVIDEWSALLRNLDSVAVELLVDTILACAEEYAGFNGYAMIAGHEWTARESGGKKGAAIRRAFHSVFVHRLDEDYAKFLLTGVNKKLAKSAPNLPTGNAHFQDSEGEIDYLIIPYYGKNQEGIYEVVTMLTQIETAPSIQALPAPSFGDNVDSMPPMPSTPSDITISDNALVTYDDTIDTSSDDKVKYIIRLRNRNIAHRDIAYMLGLYGAKYPEYQALCNDNNIEIGTK